NLCSDADDDSFYTNLTVILFLLCITGAALPPLKLGHSVCAMKADEGPCKAIHLRYYFNIQSRECEMFEYGGCHGNENNFQTLEECQKKCLLIPVKLENGEPNFCFYEKDPGICRGYFSRYFYNKETKLCEVFKYGGCLGNQNNFKNLEECQTTCQGNLNLLPTAPNEKSNALNSSSAKEELMQEETRNSWKKPERSYQVFLLVFCIYTYLYFWGLSDGLQIH
uniref:Tissue factor pathway inhibitor n=1 Tax=Strix occidentalis caurina TaxID=311401 RepID=A0A8D0EXP5_STROC